MKPLRPKTNSVHSHYRAELRTIFVPTKGNNLTIVIVFLEAIPNIRRIEDRGVRNRTHINADPSRSKEAKVIKDKGFS